MLIKRIALITALLLSAASFSQATYAEPKKFSLGWSIYVGFMPWLYLDESGIMDKWAEKYGIEVELVQVNDYIEAINLYTAGRFDGATMTNMDMLTIPAAAGVDTTALIVGDYSNGNDAVVLKNRERLQDIAGLDVYLLELSVSHYTLARALDSVGMSERDVRVVNTSDADIANAFLEPAVQAVTLWNPQLETVMQESEAVKVFDSTQIPGEILDTMGVNTATLAANPELGKALTGAWFEAVDILLSDTPEGLAARQMMAAGSGTDLAGFERQLQATYLFRSPQDKLDYLSSQRLTETMDFVTDFSFAHGLLGEGAPSADVIGIAMPDGSVLGNADFVRMRFDHQFVQLAAEGKL